MTRPILALLAVALLAPAGCRPTNELPRTYGTSRNGSLNGSDAFADLLRDQGRSVRVAARLNDDLKDQADTLVRFAPTAGGPAAEEEKWYREWLVQDPRRRVVYVARDWDAEADYWAAVLRDLPSTAPAEDRERAKSYEAEARSRVPAMGRTPKPSDGALSFGVKPGGTRLDRCADLDGPWALGIDEAAADLPRHDVLLPPRLGMTEDLLTDGSDILVMEYRLSPSNGPTLVVANGAFLLNAGMLNPARRPLALRVAEWVGEGGPRVVFVEGAEPTRDAPKRSSEFDVPMIDPLNWIFSHFLALGSSAASTWPPGSAGPAARPWKKPIGRRPMPRPSATS